MYAGGSRSGHGEESGGGGGGRTGGTRYATHGGTPGDSTPSVPQTRSRRPHDRVDLVAGNAAAPSPLDDVITSSEYTYIHRLLFLYIICICILAVSNTYIDYLFCFVLHVCVCVCFRFPAAV